MGWVLPVYTLTICGSVLEAKYSLFSQSSYSWTQNQMPSLYVVRWAPSSANLFLSVSMAHYYLATQPPCNVPFVSERQSWCAAIHQQFSPGFMTSFGNPQKSMKSMNLPQLSLLWEPSLMWCSVGTDAPRGPLQLQPCCDLSWATTCHFLVLICLLTVCLYFSLVSCLSLQVSSTLSRLSFLDFSTVILLLNVINVWRSTDCNWAMYQSWLIQLWLKYNFL